jgi:8-oxo-dGTP diphosphatase
MSGKNHIRINGKLRQTDKRFSQLKGSQKEKINEWLYGEYRKTYDRVGKPPDARHNAVIVGAAYDKIEEAEIWIPFGEVQRYFYSRKNDFRRRYERAIQREHEQKTE